MAGLPSLSAREVEIVRECLAAAVDGPFFPEWEFSTLIGLKRTEVKAVLAMWPARDGPDNQDLAVNNVLNNLLGYPHNEWRAWRRHISVPPATVALVLARWRGDNHFDSEARGFFDRLR
jgi:hypothetical protein